MDGTGHGHAWLLVLVALLGPACSTSGDVPSSDSSAAGAQGGAGGSSNGNGVNTAASGGNSASGGTTGEGGEGGESGEGGSPSGSGGGTAGAGSGGTGGGPIDLGPICTPTLDWPEDTCSYPESLGGGNDPAACGLTEGAWYGLGDSEFTVWPTRPLWTSDAGGGVRQPVVSHPLYPAQIAFDASGAPWVAANSGSSLGVQYWDGDTWLEVDPEGTPPNHRLIIDSAGQPLLLGVPQSTASQLTVEATRWTGSGWEALGPYPPLGSFAEARVTLDADDHPIVLWSTDADISIEHWTGSAWKAFGGEASGQLARSTKIAAPDLMLRPNGNPVVAWQDGEQLVREWDGSAWRDLGAESRGSKLVVTGATGLMLAWDGGYSEWDGSSWSDERPLPSGRPTVVSGPDGRLALLLNSYDVDSQLLLYDGVGWEEPLQLPHARATAAFGPDGSLGTAWTDNEHLYYASYVTDTWQGLGQQTANDAGLLGELTGLESSDSDDLLVLGDCAALHEWDGGAWQTVPLPDAQGGVPWFCRMAQNQAGELYLAFWLYMGDEELAPLQVWRRQESGWERWGQEVTTMLISKSFEWFTPPILSFDAEGRPYVLWQEELYESPDLHHAQWDGSRWNPERVRPPGPVPEYPVLDPGHVLMTTTGRRVLSVIYDGQFVVLEWTGQDWVSLEGGALDDALGVLGKSPNLVQDDGGAPVLIWATDRDLEILRWSGNEWEHLAATDDVLETLPDSARFDARSDSGEVRVRYFQDCTWHGLSASDKGGGISNTSSTPSEPLLFVQDDRVCVAWSENARREPRSVLRCHALPE